MLLITFLAKFPVLTSGKKLWVKLITKIHNSPTKDFFEYQKIMRSIILEKKNEKRKFLRGKVQNNFVLICLTTKF